jgi:peptidyl-prolyl cis-trans isomerase B (cyclophilin B)
MFSKVVLLALITAALGGAAGAQLGKTAAPGATEPKNGEEVAVMETNYGTIILKFFPNKAPQHVQKFKDRAKEGFYDGTRFHRVIPGFMIQGGDPLSKKGDRSIMGTGGPGYTIPAEFNDIKHTPGILSAARTSDPNSAGSQFFLMHGTSPHLDGQYTVYGQVVKGMDVIEKIVNLPKDGRDNPIEANKAVIKHVKIVKWPVK